MKSILKVFFAGMFAMPLVASDYSLEASSWGWGWSEASACKDAHEQVDLAFESQCESHANGNPFTVMSPEYGRCWCWEEKVNDWRCDLTAKATCSVFEAL